MSIASNRLKRLYRRARILWNLSRSPKGFFDLYRYFEEAKGIYFKGRRKKDNYRIKMLRLWVNDNPIPVYFRPSQGDLLIFDEVFINLQYKLPAGIKPPATILDLGANVGYASLFFFTYYNPSKVILVEPSRENIKVAQNNLSKQLAAGLCKVYEAAIYYKKDKIFIDNSLPAYNLKVHEDPIGVPVETVTVDAILAEERLELVDLLKMDIEGAERFLLQANTGWLARVRVLIMELHEPLDERWLLSAISAYGFEITSRNERTIVAVNRKLEIC